MQRPCLRAVVLLNMMLFRFYISAIACLFCSVTGFAQGLSSESLPASATPQTDQPFYPGHILTGTTDTPPRGTFVFGHFISGYAFTDRTFLGVSPWLYLDYEMHNLHFRQQFRKTNETETALDLSYLRSVHLDKAKSNSREIYFLGAYHQESWSARLNHSLQLRSSKLNLTLGYSYYIDELRPHSMRMKSFNSDPDQWSFSLMTETPLARSHYLNFEFGILGLNYLYPYFHQGASYSYRKNAFLAQIGASMTVSPGYESRRRTGQDFWQEAMDSENDMITNKLTSAIHPEIQIQYQF